ncbi:MAG: hypothetical protein AAF542_13845 [Pseudomonadota bacterium]
MKTLCISSALIVGLFTSAYLGAVDRLFTTVKERQILDSRRYGREQLKGDDTKIQKQSLHLNGVVTINQQPPKIWLNGEYSQSETTELQPVSNRNAVELFLRERRLHVSLKPGQKLDLLTGSRLEPYNVPQNDDVKEENRDGTENDESPDLLDEAAGGNP